MRRFTPRAVRRLPDVLSKEEAGRLVEAPMATQEAPRDAGAAGARLRDRGLLELLYGAGLRVSEAAGLDTDHVDFPGRQIRVWGKGSKARMVPLGRRAREALASYLDRGRMSMGPQPATKALFLNRRGGRLSPRSIRQIVRRYAMQAGLRDDVHPHTLRHSFATHLLDGGADLRVVQELLGHATPTATQVYTHVSQTEARRVYLSAHPLARPKP
jgi:integrase/recombinase XerC